MKREFRFGRAFAQFLVGLFAVVSLVFAGVSGAAAAEKLTICHAGLAGALIPLAKMQGYYAAEGLDVETRLVPSGFQALQAMLKGDCSLSFAAAPPIGYQSLRRNDFRILAALSSSGDFDRIIVRSDRGIHKPEDLRGRRIVAPEGTSAHYLLDTYLAANGIAASEVSKHYLPTQDIPGAFQRGEADAAALWEPRIMKLTQALTGKAKVLPSAGLVVSPFVLLVRNDYVQTHTASVHALMRALVKAEGFVRQQPAKAKALVAPYFGLNAEDTEASWALLDFRVSLDQSMLFILESVARWQIRQMPAATRPPLPNYLDFLYSAALRAAKPGAVTVID